MPRRKRDPFSSKQLVSTARRGKSGLGLEAEREAIARFAAAGGLKIENRSARSVKAGAKCSTDQQAPGEFEGGRVAGREGIARRRGSLGSRYDLLEFGRARRSTRPRWRSKATSSSHGLPAMANTIDVKPNKRSHKQG